MDWDQLRAWTARDFSGTVAISVATVAPIPAREREPYQVMVTELERAGTPTVQGSGATVEEAYQAALSAGRRGIEEFHAEAHQPGGPLNNRSPIQRGEA